MYNKCDRRAGYEIAITMHTIIQMHHRHIPDFLLSREKTLLHIIIYQPMRTKTLILKLIYI